MSDTYNIDKDSGAAFLTSDELPTLKRWKNTMRALIADPDFKPGYSLLSDRRSLKAAPSSAAIKDVVSFFEANADAFKGRELAVVVSAPAVFGMARLGSMLVERVGITIQVFTDMEEARRWLTARKA